MKIVTAQSKLCIFSYKKSTKAVADFPLIPRYKPTPKGLCALAHDLIPMRSRETFNLPELIADLQALRAHV